MAERPASGGLQAVRILMALVFLGVGVWCLLTGQWVASALMVLGVVGALASFRRGTWDRQAAKEFVGPRLVGAAIALPLFVLVAYLGFLD